LYRTTRKITQETLIFLKKSHFVGTVWDVSKISSLLIFGIPGIHVPAAATRSIQQSCHLPLGLMQGQISQIWLFLSLLALKFLIWLFGSILA